MRLLSRCCDSVRDAREHCCHLAAQTSVAAKSSRLAWLREGSLILSEPPSFPVSGQAPPHLQLMLVLITVRRVTPCCRMSLLCLCVSEVPPECAQLFAGRAVLSFGPRPALSHFQFGDLFLYKVKIYGWGGEVSRVLSQLRAKSWLR